MRVLILSQYYPPESAFYAPSLARELIKRGHQVKVLTGYPNYPSGRLFDGFRMRWRSHELGLAGERVLRVPLYVDHSRSGVRRMLNYLSFGLSAATAKRWSAGADVIYVYATQMTPALAPWVWSFFGGPPFVLHVQDLWPDSITGSSLISKGWRSRLLDAALTGWLKSVYRRAGAIVGIAPTMVETLAERGVDPSRLHLVYNWTEEAGLDNPASDGKAVKSHTRILFAGNLGDMQDLETVVRAAHDAADVGIQLRIVGDGVVLPRIRALVGELDAANIEFLGRVPREQMGDLYRTSDFALVSLKDLPVFRGTIPSKFQAAIAHGVPVITTVQGDLRELVERLRVGFTAEGEQEESLAATFRKAAATGDDGRAELVENARAAYSQNFSLNAGVQAFEAILKALSHQSGASKARRDHADS